MSTLAKHRVTFSIAALILILLLAIAAIFWARGFKPNLQKGKIERTGLVVATSIPTGAQGYLDDRLTSATNTNIAFLDPKTYKVRIQKDGYSSWEKEIEIKADLATEIKALLLPQAPEIKPLTTTGAFNPSLSPDGTKILYGQAGERGGLYSLSMSERTLPFRQNLRLIAKNQAGFDFAKSKFIWGPDSREAIARFENEKGEAVANLLIDAEKTEQDLRDITGSLNATLSSWQEQLDARAQTLALSVPPNIKEATAEAKSDLAEAKTVDSQKLSVNRKLKTVNQLNYFPAGLVFSPDEERVLFLDKDKKYRIYDLKLKKDFTLPEFADLISLSWYPDSAHLVIAQNPEPVEGLISIIEADGTNKMTIFSGKFENGFVFAHPTGDRLIILTALTQSEGNPANLYSINLR